MKIGDKVFVTKWALTSGCIRVGTLENASLTRIYVNFGDGCEWIPRRDVHMDLACAQQRVKRMAGGRLVSIRKQVERFQQLKKDGAKINPLDRRKL